MFPAGNIGAVDGATFSEAFKPDSPNSDFPVPDSSIFGSGSCLESLSDDETGLSSSEDCASGFLTRIFERSSCSTAT